MAILNKTIQYGTLLFVFLIPWQARLILSEGSINGKYWEYGTKSLYATEIALLVVLLALVVRCAIYIHKNKPKLNARRLYSPVGALLLLIIWAGASCVWSIDCSVAFDRWIALIEAIVVFLILSSGIVSYKKLCLAIILSGLIQASFAIAQFLLQSVPSSTLLGMASQDAQNLGVSVVETDLRRWLRAYGTFPHPNILGAWLALSLVLLVEKMRKQSQNLLDVLNYPMLIILLFGLGATFSRSAWLGFGIFLVIFVVWLFIRHAWIQGIKIALITILSVACFYAIFPEPMNTRLGLQARLEVKSNTEHMASVAQGWEIIKQNPLLGVGMGNYGLAVHGQIDDAQEAWFYQPVHNVYILILAELGIIGILLMAYSLWLIAFHGISKKTLLNAGVFFIPIIVIASFDHYLWSLYSGMMISAVYVGVLIALIRKEHNLIG